MITEAKHTLQLASYSFTGVRENRELLLDALADARKRGVQIEMLLRDRSRDLVEIAALLDIGVEVRANRVNHAKYAIADGERGLLFSANFDGMYGLTDGVETGDVVHLERNGEEMKASGIDRDNALFCPLPKLIATGHRRSATACLALGLEVESFSAVFDGAVG